MCGSLGEAYSLWCTLDESVEQFESCVWQHNQDIELYVEGDLILDANNDVVEVRESVDKSMEAMLNVYNKSFANMHLNNTNFGPILECNDVNIAVSMLDKKLNDNHDQFFPLKRGMIRLVFLTLPKIGFLPFKSHFW